MRFFLILLILSLRCIGHGQTVLRVTIIDRQTKDALSHVGVKYKTKTVQSKTFYTNRSGQVYVSVPTNDTLWIETEHFSYEPWELNNPFVFGAKKDTVDLQIRMRFMKSTLIDEVVIKPPGRPDTVFQSKRISVLDFEFLPNGNMMLLAYPKNPRKQTELLVYDGFEVNGEIPLQEKGLELVRDFRGNPHVVTERSVYGFQQKEQQIQIASLSKEYFMTYVAPIVDTTVSKYFFSNFNPVYPAFEYFTFDLLDSSYRKIAKIEDELMMELYRSEYKWVDVRTKLWAREKELETGIDKEIWVGANYFTQSIYYKELYAPMFERNDSVFVFDHYKNWMFRYSKHGDLLDSLPIYYHLQPKQTGWKKQLIQDQTTGQIYIVFEKAGWMHLRRFDAASGKLEESVPLFFRYPENVQVRSNTIYYTYRPFETAQKKFLYKEVLPVKFPTVQVNNGDW